MSTINKINVSLEVNENFQKLNNIFSNKKINRIKITSDTGNLYLKNKNVLSSLKKYYPMINHIHLKDRNKLGQNVLFGSGKINFKDVFIFLKKKRYNKLLTFETNRGNDALYTAINNLKIAKNLT